MEAELMGLIMSWWVRGGKDTRLMWSICAVVHTGAGTAGEQEVGEVGLWGKMLVSLKSVVKFLLVLTTSHNTTRTLQTC